MKKSLFLLVLFAVPLLLAARPFQNTSGKRPFPLLTNNRAYRLTEYTDYYYDEGSWVPIEKYHFYYNPIHGSWVDSLRIYGWVDNSWWDSRSYQFTRNSAGKSTERRMYSIYNDQHTLQEKVISTYDAQNRLTHTYYYDVDAKTLIPEARYHVFYSGNNVSALYEWGYTGTEDYFDKNTYQTDAQGRVTVSTWQVCSDSLSWVNDEKADVAYDPDDTSTAADFEYYLYKYLNEWIWEYNFFWGMMSEEIYSTYDGAAWVYDNRNTFTWDAGNQLTDVYWSTWSAPSWVAQSWYSYYYSGGNISEMIEQDNYTGNWEDSYKADYSWETFTDADDPLHPPLANLKVKLWPQPFSGTVNVTVDSAKSEPVEIGIYDLKGRKLIGYTVPKGENLIWNGKDVNGQDCASGVYLVKAVAGGASATGRIVRLK